MKHTAIASTIAFQHTPCWCAEFFVGEQLVSAIIRRAGSSAEFETFKRDFITSAQNEAIEFAADAEIIIAPTTHVNEFWTPAFINRLSSAIRRPRKRPAHYGVKKYLRAHWHDRMCNMTRRELAAHLKFACNANIKPAAAWQMAYRLDLFTKRPNGPKPSGLLQVAPRL